MAKIEYISKNFRGDSLNLIKQANTIVEDYQQQGYELTIRQVYYQFVALDLFPEERKWTWTGRKYVKDPNGTKNANPNYIWLMTTVNKGRLAGLIDWDAIVDRTREPVENQHWDSPKEIIETCARSYRVDTRETQPYYIEVWVEKDALAGILERVCRRLDVLSFACHGYTSLSAMWVAAQRLIAKEEEGKETIILHLGDHDPSGLDMTRDIQDRLDTFLSNVHVKRIALNYDQVKKYSPPPNPVKLTDTRKDKYINKFGIESWELDALKPEVIDELIARHVNELTDDTLLEELDDRQDEEREVLNKIAKKL